MKGFLRSKLALSLATLVMLAAAIAIPLASSITHSRAQGVATTTITTTIRASILTNALRWVDAHIPYNQGVHEGYREDCSGFVSMAWGLSSQGGGLTTVTLPNVATSISKDNLQPGDVLDKPLAGDAGHVIIFDRWTDSSHSHYNGYEEVYGVGTHFARNVTYPYWPNSDGTPATGYVPLRRNNLSLTTLLQVEVALPGISTVGNNQPNRPQQPLEVQVLTGNEQLVATYQSTVSYNRGTAGYTDLHTGTPGRDPGSFMGVVNLGTAWSSGTYYFKVRLPYTLRRQVPNFYTIVNNTATVVQMTPLVSGDINSDNVIDLLDYNILIGCYGSKANTSSCLNKVGADLNEDGAVDGIDYNTWLGDLQCSWC